jgi:L-histidine Nalpha-methyltransferase
MTLNLDARPHAAFAAPRQINATFHAKYFYDETGSLLFERICETPEYYPTRTEIGLLRDSAAEMASLIGPAAHLVELGSGPSTKVRILLDAAPGLASYIPVDISGAYLMQSAAQVAADYPSLTVKPVTADFTRGFSLPRLAGRGRVVGFFPGSTIGNFAPAEARALLRRFGAALGAGSGLLIGVDLKKDVGVLEAAYNDRAGVTAAFNLNLLSRIRKELDSDIDVGTFAHRAVYNAGAGRIEMYLDSRIRQSVRVGSHLFPFDKGEPIATEHSYKFEIPEFKALAAAAGYTPRALWHDQNRYFSVFYLTLDN